MPEYRFGAFSFVLPEGLLSKGNQKIALGQRGAALLTLLLDRRGEPVAKAELLDAAWPNLAIEESNLTVQVAALRRALGASPNGRDWILTVPRVGYRFLTEAEQNVDRAPTASEQPSIAVLPFANLGGDADQDFFALGLADDLITDLSKVPGLTVMARSSSFAYARRDTDPADIAARLGVRFVVEGSVRRSAATVRINAQLVDAASRHQIWADRIDGGVENVFALQDDVARRIVAALGHVLPAPRQQLAARPPVHAQAYELFARGRALVLDSPDHFVVGRSLLEQATQIEPSFAEAYAWLAMGLVHGHYLWGAPTGNLRAAGVAAARKAIELDYGSAAGHAFLGYALFYEGDFEGGEAEMELALVADPNYADGWILSSEMKAHLGDHDSAREEVSRAFTLNPHPPGFYYWARGFIEFAGGDYEGTIQTLSNVATRRSGSQRILAAALAQLGRIEDARLEAAEFLSRNAHFSISDWLAGHPPRSAADLDRFAEGYRLAGLPS
jgi:TolB-like protein